MRLFYLLTIFLFTFLVQLIGQEGAFFVQELTSVEVIESTPIKVLQDDIGRYWVLSENNLQILTSASLKSIHYYNKYANVEGATDMYFIRDKLLLVLFQSKQYAIFNLITNEWKKNIITNKATITDGEEVISIHDFVLQSKVSDPQNTVFVNHDELFMKSDTVFVKDQYGHIEQANFFRRNATNDDFQHKFINDGKLYLYDKQRLYTLDASINRIFQYRTSQLFPSSNVRECFPYDDGKYFLSFNTYKDLFVVENELVYNLCVNDKHYCDKYFSKTLVFHCSQYDVNHLVLLDADSKLHLYNKNTKTFFLEQRVNQLQLSLKNIFTDSKGNIWIGTYADKLIKYHPQTDQLHVFDSRDCTTLNDIYRIYEDRDGLIWIGMNKGFVIYDSRLGNFYTSEIFKNHAYAIHTSSVSAFGEDSMGNMWVGTYGLGLFYFDKKEILKRLRDNDFENKKLATLKSWNDENFFLTKRINYINVHDDKQLVVRTKTGLLLLDKDKRYRYIDTNMGFPYAMNNFYNYCIDGHYISGMNSGFLIGDIRALENLHFQKPIIDEFYLGEEQLPLDYYYTKLGKIQLDANVIYFSIKPSFAYPNKVFESQYMLGDSSHFFVNNGILIFLYKLGKQNLMINSNLANNSSEALSISYVVNQVWYKRKWFRVMQGVFFLGVLGFGIYNLRRQKRLQQKISTLQNMSLRSQMNPHFISNSLNSINLYVLENKTEEASQYIVKFSKLIRQILNNTREEFVTLKAELDSVEMYIQMEKLRFKEKFEYEIHIDESVDMEYRVPSMLIQPIVENAIWHGILQSESNGNLTIDVRKNMSNTLEVTIKDDGIGREAAKRIKSKKANKRKSYGQDIVKQRIQLLNSVHNKQYKIMVSDLHPKALHNIGTIVRIQL